MDPKTKGPLMNYSNDDLPEPPSIPLDGLDSKTNHRWHTIKVLLIVSVIYSFAHKVIIPLSLKWIGTNQPRYAEIDWWFIPGVILISWLGKQNYIGRVASLLSGICISHGFLELWQVARGAYIGWLNFSHLLSSLPTALICVALLLQIEKKPHQLLSWIAALLTVFITISLMPANEAASPVSSTRTPREIKIPQIKTELSAETCGAQQLEISNASINQFEPKKNTIAITSCGLRPAVVDIRKNKYIEFKNELHSPVNLHLLYLNKQNVKQGWNVLIPQNRKIRSPLLKQIMPGQVAMIYSDSTKGVGISAVVHSPVLGHWSLNRSPLILIERHENRKP